MHNLFGRKAQFFILTTVVIVGIFSILSKYINPYSFIDTSRAIEGGEIFFFDNVKEKANKTVEITNSTNTTELRENLDEYKDFVERMAGEKGYDLVFDYTIYPTNVNTTIILVSRKYTLKTNFIIPRKIS